MAADHALLAVSDLKHRFGGVQAVDGCSFNVPQGSVSALIGPNGAGKSTVVNLVSGALPLQSGHMEFLGKSIGGRPAYQIARAGLIRTFQLSRELRRMTVTENLLVASQSWRLESPWVALFGRKASRTLERELLSRIGEMLTELGLYGQRDTYAGELSGGQKRLLELARALIVEPKMVILDEPMAGVNPVLIDRVVEVIQRFNARGVTFLLVEHKLEVVDALCDQVVVMAAGRVIATGSMGEVRQDSAVVEAYIGRAN